MVKRIMQSSINYDILDHLNRFNISAVATLISGDKVECSVGLFFGDLTLFGNFPKEMQYKHYMIQRRKIEYIEYEQ